MALNPPSFITRLHSAMDHTDIRNQSPLENLESLHCLLHTRVCAPKHYYIRWAQLHDVPTLPACYGLPHPDYASTHQGFQLNIYLQFLSHALSYYAPYLHNVRISLHGPIHDTVSLDLRAEHNTAAHLPRIIRTSIIL